MQLRDRPAAAILAVAIALAVAGQFSLVADSRQLGTGVAFFAAAAILFLVSTGRAGAGLSTVGRWVALLPPHVIRLLLIAIALGLNLMAVRFTLGAPASYWPAFWLWLASAALYTAAFVPRWPRPNGEAFPGFMREHGDEVAAVALCIVLGFVLRYFDLTGIPRTVGGDEGTMGLQAMQVLQGRMTNMFATGWLSHPTFWFFLQALSMKLFGTDVFGLRLLSVLLGTLTIPLFYLLVRRLFDRELALVATLLFTFYDFHIHYSRLAANNIADPLFACLTLWLLCRGIAGRRRLDFVLAGLALGLAQYFYMGARLIPIIVVVYLALRVVKEREFLGRHWADVVAMFFAVWLIVAPLYVYFWQHPGVYNSRLNQVGIIQSGWLEREQAITNRTAASLVAEQFRRSAFAFNYYHDRVVWYGPSRPLLGFAASIFFVFGLAYAMYRGLDHRYSLFTVWFWLGVVFGSALMESPPSSMRLVTLAPVLCFLVAVGVFKVIELGQRAGLYPAGVVRYVVVVAVIALTWLSIKFYFFDYTPSRVYGSLNGQVATEMAYYLRALGPEYRAYFFGAPRMYYDFGTIPFIARGVEGLDVRERGDIRPDLFRPDKNAVFIFVPERLDELRIVQEMYPNGLQRDFPDEARGNTLFVAYEVSREALRRR